MLPASYQQVAFVTSTVDVEMLVVLADDRLSCHHLELLQLEMTSAAVMVAPRVYLVALGVYLVAVLQELLMEHHILSSSPIPSSWQYRTPLQTVYHLCQRRPVSYYKRESCVNNTVRPQHFITSANVAIIRL